MSCLLQNPTGIPFYYTPRSLGLVMEPRKCQPLDPYQHLQASSLEETEIVEEWNPKPKHSQSGKTSSPFLNQKGTSSTSVIVSTSERHESSLALNSQPNPRLEQNITRITLSSGDDESIINANTMPSIKENLTQQDILTSITLGNIIELQKDHPSFKTPSELNTNTEPGAIFHGEEFSKFRYPVTTESSYNSSRSSSLSLPPIQTLINPVKIKQIAYEMNQRRHSCNANFSASSSSGSSGSATSSSSSSLHQSGQGPATLRHRSNTYSSSKTQNHPYACPRKFSAFAAVSPRTSEQGLESEYIAQRDLDCEARFEMNRDDDNFNPNDNPGTPRSGMGDASNFQFLGPIGKKKRMARDRQRSSDSQDVNSPEDSNSSNTTPIDQLGIQEEQEDELGAVGYDNFEEPLNLCIGDETEATLDRVKDLSISSPPDETLHYRDLPLHAALSPNRPGPSTRPSIIKKATRSPKRNKTPDPMPSTSQSLLREHLIAHTSSITIQTEDEPSRHYANRIPFIPEHLRENQEASIGDAVQPIAVAAVFAPSRRPGRKSPAGKKTPEKKKLQCPECGKEFSQLRNYRYHRSRHEGTSQFACTCPICGKKFNDKGYLSSHLKIHRNAKEYACEWCDKCFNQRVAYNMHIRIHTGLKPHHCEVCPKSFSRKMLLRQHLRTHTGERPYSCDVCGKAFADRSNMLLHQRLHSGERPYKCDQCGKSFSKNHHLKTHLNHHAGIKPYQCIKCLACFSQSSNMKTHYRKCTATVSAPASVMPTIPEFGMLESGNGSHSQMLVPRSGRGSNRRRGSSLNSSPIRHPSFNQTMNLNLSMESNVSTMHEQRSPQRLGRNMNLSALLNLSPRGLVQQSILLSPGSYTRSNPDLQAGVAFGLGLPFPQMRSPQQTQQSVIVHGPRSRQASPGSVGIGQNISPNLAAAASSLMMFQQAQANNPQLYFEPYGGSLGHQMPSPSLPRYVERQMMQNRNHYGHGHDLGQQEQGHYSPQQRDGQYSPQQQHHGQYSPQQQQQGQYLLQQQQQGQYSPQPQRHGQYSPQQQRHGQYSPQQQHPGQYSPDQLEQGQYSPHQQQQQHRSHHQSPERYYGHQRQYEREPDQH